MKLKYEKIRIKLLVLKIRENYLVDPQIPLLPPATARLQPCGINFKNKKTMKFKFKQILPLVLVCNEDVQDLRL